MSGSSRFVWLIRQSDDIRQGMIPFSKGKTDVTSSSQNHLQVYADLGVAKLWVYNGESLVIQQLQSGMYITS